MYQSFLIELINSFSTQSVDVHGFTANIMFDFSFNLWWTGSIIRTIMGRLALISCQRATTFRTTGNKTNFVAQHETSFLIHSHNLRNDFTPLFHIHHITQTQIQSFNNVSIVQGSTFDHRSGQLNRFQISHRSYGTGTPYLIGYHIQTGTCTFCLEFIGNCPTRRLGRIPQITLLTERIDLQDNTISSHRKILALHIPITDKFKHLFQRATLSHDVTHLESPFRSGLHILVMPVTRKVLTQ